LSAGPFPKSSVGKGHGFLTARVNLWLRLSQVYFIHLWLVLEWAHTCSSQSNMRISLAYS
jgi:hypothetical protein